MKYCSSGLEVLKLVESFKPDLILLDMMMPGMGGAETLKELRKLPSLKTTPVIFITAKVLTNELDQYRKLGALDVIAKPFDPLTLHELLRVIWNEHGGTTINYD